MTAMDDATAVLQQRDQIEAAAAALGLEPGRRAEVGVRDAHRTASACATAARRRPARGPRPRSPTRRPGSTRRPTSSPRSGCSARPPPAATYEAARAAFERGELDAAISSAAAVTTLLADAAALGQQRLLIGAVVAGVLLLLAVVVVLRRRRRRQAPLALAAVAAGPAIDALPRPGVARGRALVRATDRLARVAAPGPPARDCRRAAGTGLVAAHEGVARPGTAGPLRYTRHRSGQPFAAARRESAGSGGRRLTR